MANVWHRPIQGGHGRWPMASCGLRSVGHEVGLMVMGWAPVGWALSRTHAVVQAYRRSSWSLTDGVVQGEQGFVPILSGRPLLCGHLRVGYGIGWMEPSGFEKNIPYHTSCCWNLSKASKSTFCVHTSCTCSRVLLKKSSTATRKH